MPSVQPKLFETCDECGATFNPSFDVWPRLTGINRHLCGVHVKKAWKEYVRNGFKIVQSTEIGLEGIRRLSANRGTEK